MPMIDYPDWVLKYKEHNKEIRFINGKYYLYSVHTVRNKDKVKKITDEYLGRITIDGFIPKVKKEIVIQSKEYYTTVFVFNVFANTILSLKKKNPKTWDKYLKVCCKKVIFNDNELLWNKSYLSILLRNCDFLVLNSITINEIERINKMFKYHLESFLTDHNLFEFFYSISDLQMIQYKNEWILSTISEDTKMILNKYKFKLENYYGQTK